MGKIVTQFTKASQLFLASQGVLSVCLSAQFSLLSDWPADTPHGTTSLTWSAAASPAPPPATSNYNDITMTSWEILYSAHWRVSDVSWRMLETGTKVCRNLWQ